MALEQLTANLSDKVRHDTIGDRSYMVAPMVMMVEGVHNGSVGPLLYPADELAASAEAFNHMPVVVYHPQNPDGTYKSARDHTTLTNQGIGMILNSRFEDGKLKAEAWIEADRANLVDDRVIAAMEDNTPMELSTGVFVAAEQTEGEWNGETYKAVARNHRADHLALLPDKKGACSLADGAGFLVNEDGATLPYVSQLAQNLGVDMRSARTVLAYKGAEFADLVDNAKSHSNIYRDLSDWLSANVGSEDKMAWVEDVFAGFFVYSHDGGLFRRDYSIDATDTVSVAGEAEPVVRVTEYRTTDGAFVGNTAERETSMDRKTIVQQMVSNSDTQWTEQDVEFLEGLDDDRFAKVTGNTQAPAATETPAANADVAPAQTVALSAEQVLNALPADMRAVLSEGLQVRDQDRQRLISTITANERNTFTEDTLKAMPTDQLRSLAELARPDDSPTANEDVLQSYFGQNAPAGRPTANEEEVEPLGAPSFDLS